MTFPSGFWTASLCSLLTLLVAGYFAGLEKNLNMLGGGNGSGRRGRLSGLASVVHDRLLNDRQLLDARFRSGWYLIREENITESRVKELFIRMNHEDEETERFIQESIQKSDQFFTQMWHNLAKTALNLVGYSKTDINAMLGRGSMFVMSKEHFRALTGVEGNHESAMDLGAGDGNPSKAFAEHYAEMFATEASVSMVKVLEGKGFKVLPVDSWHLHATKFDFIACLNLLDRCAEPKTVLGQMRRAVKPESGIILVAVVLPFRPYVEYTADHRPAQGQGLQVEGTIFEVQVESLFGIFEESGFRVVRWTRVPYLCEGDMARSVYSLDDAIFVLKKQ